MRSRLILMCLLSANALVGAWLLLQPAHAPIAEPTLAALNSPEGLTLVSDRVPRETASPAPLPSRECRIWGPVTSADALSELRTALAAEGGLPELVERTVAGEPDYLVYVESLGSTNTVRGAVAELKRMKVDSYLMSREPLKLSVGVYSTQERAQRLQRSLRDIGYGVAIETLPRAQKVFSLSAHVFADSPLYEKSVSSCSAIAQGG